MKLEGIIAACVTPWKQAKPQGASHPSQVDEAALGRHLEMLLSAGVHGLCVGGSTGEFPRLEQSEFSRLVCATVKIAAGRVPVIAGIGSAAIEGSLELARLAAQAGADAVLAPPPFYFPYGQPEITVFFERLGKEVELPLLLYNIPQFTSPLETETAVNLLRQGPFAGIKDSGGDPEMLAALLAARREHAFTLLSGYDATLAGAVEMGIDGAVSGIAACAPEVMVRLYGAARSGDRPRAKAFQASVNELIARLERFPAPVGIRIALEARGLPVGPHSIPLARETEAAAREFALWFEQWLGRESTQS